MRAVNFYQQETMSTFFIHTVTPGGPAGPTLRYDNQTSELTNLQTG